MARFFAAFVSGSEAAVRAEALRTLFLPGAVVVRTCGTEPLVCSVEEFIRPRVDLLGGGGLADFRERPDAGRVDVFGDVAHVWCSYAKSWIQDGAAHEGAGMKSLQLVRTAAGWRISALAWDDERPGLRVPDPLPGPETLRERG